MNFFFFSGDRLANIILIFCHCYIPCCPAGVLFKQNQFKAIPSSTHETWIWRGKHPCFIPDKFCPIFLAEDATVLQHLVCWWHNRFYQSNSLDHVQWGSWYLARIRNHTVQIEVAVIHFILSNHFVASWVLSNPIFPKKIKLLMMIANPRLSDYRFVPLLLILPDVMLLN